MKSISLVLVVVAVATAMPAVDNGLQDTDVLGKVMSVMKGCQDGDIALCLKEKALRYVESFATAREMSITDGVSLVGTGSPRSARALEPLSENPEVREQEVESRLLDIGTDFLENHVLQFRIPKAAVEGVKRSLEEEGRGKKKKIKKLMPLIGLLKLKILAVGKLFLGILAFTAVKALILAKVALAIAGLLAIKKLLSQKSSHESYEVVATPHHHDEHFSSGGGGGGHGWGRSVEEAQNLAYSGHIKQA